MQDWYKKFANQKRRPITFEEGDQVFLQVPEQSQTLSTGPVPKLLPRYCSPFKIFKRVGQVAYKLDLPVGSCVHPVFRVSRLRKRLYEQDNVVDPGIIVEYEEPLVQPHEPERVLDTHDLRTRHNIRRQVLVKWKDRPDEGSTWENITTLRKHFSSFVSRTKTLSEGGSSVRTLDRALDGRWTM